MVVVVVVLVLVVLVIMIERVGGGGIEGKEVSRGWLVGDDGPDRLMVRVIITRGGRRFPLESFLTRFPLPLTRSLVPFRSKQQQQRQRRRRVRACGFMRCYARQSTASSATQ
jgi:hypothetical protein